MSKASKREVIPSDDRLYITDPEIGNFEWWYFDVVDVRNQYVLKLVAHIGTDPLRRRFFPQAAITLRTPSEKRSFIKRFPLSDFSASTEYCDVRLKDEFHASFDSSGTESRYQVKIHMNEFSADLTFIGEIEGWKPLDGEVILEKSDRKGAFFWVVPLPKARVLGEFSIGSKTYTLEEAYGYHDHNYWKVNVPRKLFMDEMISRWYWGRCMAKDRTIVFMDTYLKNERISSLLIARDNEIIHSSRDSIQVRIDEVTEDRKLRTEYPSRMTIRSTDERNPFQMVMESEELIDKRDLLEGIHPLVKVLIKFFVFRPVYFGMTAESVISSVDEEIKGTAIYEMMLFRDT